MRPADTCFGRQPLYRSSLHPVHPLRHKPRWKLLRQNIPLPPNSPATYYGFILMAPCLLETNFSKNASTLDILLPASAFEKVPACLDKIPAALPIFCGLLMACLKGLLSLSGSEFLQYFATHITMFRIHNTQILTYVILHASAFIGYFAFSRQVLLKKLHHLL